MKDLETKPAIKITTTPEFLSGGGEMGQRIREYDWSTTPLGPVESWPQSLRTCIRIMLTSRQPIWIGWGKDLIKFYNDPYKDIVMGMHPWALGSPASVVWKAIWDDIEPMLKVVMEKDQGTYVEQQLLIMERNGYPEETYYTFSYTPIPGDDGGTAGMICANTDDTNRIIGERQMQTITQLAQALSDPGTGREVAARTIEILKKNPYDFPFAIFRSIKGNKAVLEQTTDLGESVGLISKEVDLTADNDISKTLRLALTTRQLQLFENLSQRVGKLPTGAWKMSPDKAMVLPITQSATTEPYGVLIVGVNPHRLLDEKYRSFFSLVTDQIAASFARVNMLEEERKRVTALAEVDRAKTTFFSNISHEFRTPLTLLLAPVEDALNDVNLSKENKLRMEVAYRNALRMQKLVNTLLEFSRIEAGRHEGKFKRVDVCRLTEDLASTFRSAIERSGMHLRIRCDKITDDVYLDVDMWERIVLNLISNAFKYSNKGEIGIDITQSGGMIHVAVSDTGVGIPADQIDRIFDRFHRVENTGGRSQEGTGIGLAMVKELVKLHHGLINVTSESGKGSVFTVSIPVGKDHIEVNRIIETDNETSPFRHSAAFVEEALKWLPGDEGEEQKESTTTADVRGRSKVLLADDNADMREYVKRLLSDQFTVVTAKDGEEAFQKVLAFRPDLLLTDVMMPTLDGFGLLKKVRSHPETKNIPVIFLSARAGEEAKVEGLDAGADDYLVKPFSAKELMVRVTNLIRINQVRRETELQFYQLFLQAPALVNIFKGPEFVYELFHPKNKEIFGDVDYTGMRLVDALPELKGQEILKLLNEVYHDGKTVYEWERKVVLHNASGENVDRYFNLIYQPWYDLKGRIQGVLNFAIDVTEQVVSRKRVEESEKQYRDLSGRLEVMVEQRTSELKRSNDDLQQFAHVASHDLKEPVRKLKTYINRLEDEFREALPSKGIDYLERMRQASQRMYSMIEGVLKYSSISDSTQEIEWIDINKVIETIEADLEVMINQKGAVIRKGKLPTLQGAQVLIYQLFYNLINNSLKFNNLTPEIAISSSIVKVGEKGFAEIVVSDNGIGFDQQFADRLFDAFLRLHSKDKYEGTGLGLALCKKIVERHHGTIKASGEEGKGSKFTIVLPLNQDDSRL